MDKNQILKSCNEMSNNYFMKTLSIEFIDIGKDFLTAKMPVNSKVMQPDMILHGGASAALAESVGSAATYIFKKDPNLIVRGIEITSNHVKSVAKGYVFATARPINIGKTIQLWEIKITNEKNELICLSKLTTYTKKNRKQ